MHLHQLRLLDHSSEETEEDVQSRMQIVQEGASQQMAELEDFLQAEVEFVEKYHEILMGLKGDCRSR